MIELRKKYSNLFRNLPGNSDWEGSFYENLVENGIWDEVEFWKLHFDLIDIARDSDEKNIDRNISAAVMRIYVKIASLISAHFRQNDIFRIHGLSDSKISEYKERLDLAAIGAFSGEILEERRFDTMNPLLDLHSNPYIDANLLKAKLLGLGYTQNQVENFIDQVIDTDI